MKQNCNMSQRFVREYANYKIRLFRELEKDFSDHKERHDGDIAEINKIVLMWERGLVSTEETIGLLNRI